jgi:hypothetical protein
MDVAAQHSLITPSPDVIFLDEHLKLTHQARARYLHLQLKWEQLIGIYAGEEPWYTNQIAEAFQEPVVTGPSDASISMMNPCSDWIERRLTLTPTLFMLGHKLSLFIRQPLAIWCLLVWTGYHEQQG